MLGLAVSVMGMSNLQTHSGAKKLNFPFTHCNYGPSITMPKIVSPLPLTPIYEQGSSHCSEKNIDVSTSL